MKATEAAPYCVALSGLEDVKIDMAPMIHMQQLMAKEPQRSVGLRPTGSIVYIAMTVPRIPTVLFNADSQSAF